MQGRRPGGRRPAHSAHGQLYWWLVKWPLSVWPWARRAGRVVSIVRDGERDVSPVAPVTRLDRARAVRPRRAPPPPPPPPPPAPPRRLWGTHEGSVRPIWEQDGAGG